MRYTQLRAFHMVAREGNFTRAAGLLHVSQPAVTTQVRALEDAYGSELFHRRGRRVEMTELGIRLFAVTKRLFAVEEEAEEILSAARELSEGELRIGADGPYYVIGLLAAFSQLYPGIKISLAIGNSEEVVRALIGLRTDIAVLAEPRADERLIVTPFMRDRLVVIVNDKHPLARRKSVTMAELGGHEMVLREAGSVTRRIFEDALAEHGVSPRVAMEMESREAVREAVAQGLGLGVIAEGELGHDSRLVSLPVVDAELRSGEYMICLKERANLRLMRAFLDAAQAHGTADS